MVFGYEFVKQKLKLRIQVEIPDNEEWLPLVNEQGGIIGKGVFTPNFEYEYQLLKKEIFL